MVYVMYFTIFNLLWYHFFFCIKFYFEKIILFTTHNTNKFVEFTKYLVYIKKKLLDPQVTKQYTKWRIIWEKYHYNQSLKKKTLFSIWIISYVTLYSFQSQESTKYYKIRKMTINRRKKNIWVLKKKKKKTLSILNTFQSVFLNYSDKT